MRILLLVNEAATSVTRNRQALIRHELARRHDLDVATTAGRGHATELASAAADDGAEVVVVLGGDGTLNEAANGLVGRRCALAALAGGSTNVFARTIGMPPDAEQGVRVLLAALERGSVERIDVGTANGRAFLFHAGLGYDAAVISAVERHPTLKRRGGPFAYAAAVAGLWCRGAPGRLPPLTLHLPDGTAVDGGRYVIVLNTDPYTYVRGRPVELSAEAARHRPLVAVSVHSLGPRTLGGLLSRAWRPGRPGRPDPAVRQHPGLAELLVTAGQPFPHQLDGDHLGAVDELLLRHRPDALDVVLP